jgi:hypothetical protein
MKVRDWDLAWSDMDGVVKFLAEPELEGTLHPQPETLSHQPSISNPKP